MIRRSPRRPSPLHPNRGAQRQQKYHASVLRPAKRIPLGKLEYQALRVEVYEQQNGRCGEPKCQRSLGNYGELHHVKFKSHGGFDTAENAVMLCAKCHGARHGLKVIEHL